MLGIIFSIVAGVSMSLQGVFNTRLGEKIGSWQTNTLVQASGVIITGLILLFQGSESWKGFRNLKNANKLYMLGGVLGVIIIYTVMKGIKDLGPTCAIATILVAQLTAAGIIDAFGLFDTKPVSFGFTKILGVAVMIAGIIIFKLKC